MPYHIEVPAGHTAFLEGQAVGTQNYICLPSGWTFFGPQATLCNDLDEQAITHFLSSNPDENGTPRATWPHSGDMSTVWAMAIASSSNPGFVAPGDIPLLLLQVVGAQDEPAGSDKLSETTFIHRLNTSGGVAPSTDGNSKGRELAGVPSHSPSAFPFRREHQHGTHARDSPDLKHCPTEVSLSIGSH